MSAHLLLIEKPLLEKRWSIKVGTAMKSNVLGQIFCPGKRVSSHEPFTIVTNWGMPWSTLFCCCHLLWSRLLSLDLFVPNKKRAVRWPVSKCTLCNLEGFRFNFCSTSPRSNELIVHGYVRRVWIHESGFMSLRPIQKLINAVPTLRSTAGRMPCSRAGSRYTDPPITVVIVLLSRLMVFFEV
jgi:hypothetical protein